MKTALKLMTCFLAGMLTNNISSAQCTPSSPTAVLTYDTTLIGAGVNDYNLTFPKFDPEMGTLIGIRLQSVVSVRYGFSLENQQPNPKSSRTRFFRNDDIMGSTLPLQLSNEFQSPYYGFYALAGDDGIVGSGPDFRRVGTFTAINNDTLINETRYNVANYLGPGSVAFHYITYTDDLTTSGTTIDGNMTDAIKFNISYVFCAANILAPEIIRISAENAGPLSAIIKWKTTNESKAKSYEVLVSSDGKNFTIAGHLPAAGNFTTDQGSYSYKYNFTTPADKLYFRVRQITTNNRVLISAVRPVAWHSKSRTISFIPDQFGSYLTVQLPVSGGEAWTVDLLGVNGQLIQQNKISNSVTNMLPIRQKLASGVYVVRATNISTSEMISKKILIH